MYILLSGKYSNIFVMYMCFVSFILMWLSRYMWVVCFINVYILIIISDCSTILCNEAIYVMRAPVYLFNNVEVPLVNNMMSLIYVILYCFL